MAQKKQKSTLEKTTKIIIWIMIIATIIGITVPTFMAVTSFFK